MILKEIKNSPGYFISNTGKVFNSDNKQIKPFLKKDGYERVRLPSLRHNGKSVNFSPHLLVAEAFLNAGRYVGDKDKQINHIDGDKLNNDVSNLEVVTGTENVNHAHNMGLYTYDLEIDLLNKETKECKKFRSIRELSRYFKVSLNYLKPRLIISQTYPIYGKYIARFDYIKYLSHISKLKASKVLFAYCHFTKKRYTLTAYSQISILFGLSYITIGKKLNKEPEMPVYCGGYTFSLFNIDKGFKWKPKDVALKDRNDVWIKLITSV